MIESRERPFPPSHQAETALAALHRSVAASQFYPPNHPVLAEAIREGYSAWRPLEADHRWEEAGLQLRAGSLWLEDRRLGQASPAISTLARTFSGHALVSLRRQGLLTAEGFAFLVSLLAAAPDALVSRGGIIGAWARSPHASALELRGLTVAAGADREEPGPSGEGGLDSDPPAPGREVAALSDPLLLGRLQAFQQRSPRERRVLELLLRLERTDDITAFLTLLREVTRHVESYLEVERYRESFLVVLFLYRAAQNLEALGEAGKRDYLLDTVRLVVRGEFLQWLIARVCSQRRDEEAEVGEYILRTLGRAAAVPLLNALVAEKSRAGRRRLVEILVCVGDPVVPWAIRMLDDQRWFVVRNMVTVLGGIASPEASRAVMRLADDPDSRVRKEVARALGGVPGPAAQGQLIRYLEDSDAAVRLMAASASVAHRGEPMLQALCRAYRQIPIRGPNWSLKGPILQAIGRMRMPVAVDLLAAPLRRRPLLWRKRWQTVQRAAAQALGDLGGDRARALLEGLRKHRNPELRRAAVRALAALDDPAREAAP